ncbi:nose resistant to fluoxetine protein 6-like [Macrosteles quadrilineatus]|uniref:nose resistant to fluoxetine protein 6-like n=1 Tax=Macrosteles quadrilineatus TaxID=74068 RepID=UPI0023E1574C|nr:nose resistant to fluoxetine protein 6-like [Macrosteles quadrilineatus]
MAEPPRVGVVFDASALAPNGFISADTFQFGHFDECISIDVPEEHITGKYCLAKIAFRPEHDLYPRWYDPPSQLYTGLPSNASVWQKLKTTQDPRIIRRDVLHWAVCVPSSCRAQDIQDSLNTSLSVPLRQQGILSDITINPSDCYSIWEAPAYSMGYYIVVGFIYLMFGLCTLATLVDYATEDEAMLKRSLRSFIKVFSTYSNMRKLCKTNPDADFKLLHCLKYLSMTCVILGHKEMYLNGKPVQNPYFIETFPNYVSSMLFLNGGNYIVDTFFVFSGFLTTHFLTKELQKRQNINLFLVIIGRFIRILPVYGLVIAFHAVVLPYLGNGPLWNSLVWREALRCQKNWWANVLFLNNYVNVEETCMIQAWYLACDMHYFIIGIILIYITYKRPKLGASLIGIAFAASVAIPTYITYVNQYPGVVQLYHELQKDPVKNEHFRTMYVPSHVRFVPYVVGMLMSYLQQYLARISFKFSGWTLVFLIPIGLFFNLSTTFIAYIFYEEGRPYSLLESVVYVAVHRVIWAVTISAYIIIDYNQGIGKWGSIFRHRAWAPLGRLVYCAFLIHTIPMLYTVGQRRTAPYHSRMLAAVALLGEVSLAFFLALFLNLAFESPLQRVQKMILKKLMGGPQKGAFGQQNLAQVTDSRLTLTNGSSKTSIADLHDTESKVAINTENHPYRNHTGVNNGNGSCRA